MISQAGEIHKIWLRERRPRMLVTSLLLLGNSLPNAMRNPNDERIAHAERTIDVAHAGIRPALGETLQLVQLVGNEPSIPTV